MSNIHIRWEIMIHIAGSVRENRLYKHTWAIDSQNLPFRRLAVELDCTPWKCSEWLLSALEFSSGLVILWIVKEDTLTF